MARGKSFKRGNRKTFGARDDSNAQGKWSELIKENEKWETYYKKLALFPESEWEAFKKTCQTPLPLTFRITGSRKHAREVLRLFKEKHLPHLTNVTFEGELLRDPIELHWYPGKLAWQLDVPKAVIRRNEEFAKMQRFLVLENDVGNISRQEAVSMIPPIVLGVESHHTVLDMCAAPGSKTAQMIEALHMDTDEPTGFVVANDSDTKRSHMLVHQLKRLNSANVLVVNHDAQFFPRVKLSRDDDKNNILKFDRILCDVPCSGDGTMRKNVNVWRDWNPQNGLGLHTVQFNILNRGLHLLKVGGRLVYSTCSLNPIENEAVVAQALRTWGNKIRLVNCDDALPGLIRANGIRSWPVIGRNMEERHKGDEGSVDSWFPPTEEEAANFHLENCMRVYPHQQNTGGFFITLFEKLEEFSGPSKKISTSDSTDQEPVTKKAKVAQVDTTDSAPVKKEKLPRDANEEPFVFVSPEHESLKTCWSFYGIDDKFDKTTCLVRNATGEPTRVVYTVTTPLKQIIQANEDRLKIIYSGVKLFVAQRSDIECPWRVQSESLPIMKHHMLSDRIVKANLEMLKLLLLESFPTFEMIEEANVDSEFVDKIKKLSSGCAFVTVPRNGVDEESLFLPVWKGPKSVNLMVCKEETHELLYRIFGVETSAKAKAKKEEEASAPATDPATGATNGQASTEAESKEGAQ